jgi:hypothetical protein
MPYSAGSPASLNAHYLEKFMIMAVGGHSRKKGCLRVNQEVWSAKVHFIAGKGGVGKTSVSKALAQLFAKHHKTLLVTLSEEPSGDAEPRIALIDSVSANLSVIKIYPDQALYEYLCLKAPSQKILDSLLSQRLFRALCAAMPGLSDLTRLGKIWFHADEVNGPKKQVFDKIVVDMPSTGFVSRFLSIAAVVYDAVKLGPVAKEARLIRDYFLHPKHARVHMVALPEELVVNETIDLYKQLKKSRGIEHGVLFINRVLKLDLKNVPQIDSCPHLLALLKGFRARITEEAIERQRLVDEVLWSAIVIEDFLQAPEPILLKAMLNDISCGFAQ